MIRAWIAHNTLHVSLLLGMWQDAPQLEIDEREAWGELLADLIQHVANGLQQSHCFAADETIAIIRLSLLSHLEDEDQDPQAPIWRMTTQRTNGIAVPVRHRMLQYPSCSLAAQERSGGLIR